MGGYWMTPPARWWADSDFDGWIFDGVHNTPRWYCLAIELGGRAFRGLMDS